jgi:MFS family permease
VSHAEEAVSASVAVQAGTSARPTEGVATSSGGRTANPYSTCALIGLGGLFAGVTGPLLSTFIPPLVRDALGEHRTLIGLVMAIDNVLLLLLVPLAGAASDRATARGRSRLPLVLGGFVLASLGMALFPASPSFGIAGIIFVIVVLYTGINVQRSPFQALVADLVPSRYRSLATGSVTFQMCVGAIVFLMLGRLLGMQAAFLIASAAVIAIAGAFAFGLREPAAAGSQATEATFASLLEAAWSAPATAHLPDVHDVVRAPWHGAVRRAAGGRDDRVHRVGDWRGARRAAGGRHRRADRPA